MKRVASPWAWLALLATTSFSIACTLQPLTVAWRERAASGDVLRVLLGEGRRLFANHFFIRADVYFHSGYYPSIFDQAQKPAPTALSGDHEHDAHQADEHERQMAFLGQPRDWIERFGRHFRITEHTHLAHGQEREILPWLRLSAELDPQRVQTYTVAAYWLRTRLGKVAEARDFLREGLRNNPDSYEILFELGRLYHDNEHDTARARNLWELALRRWNEREGRKKAGDQDLFALEQIAVRLARLEESEGNLDRAIQLLELARRASPYPAALDAQIAELRARLAARPTSP
jgi:tetratricopeptide (TPR) repeat protein